MTEATSSVRAAALLLTAMLGQLTLPARVSALTISNGYDCTVVVNGSDTSAQEICNCRHAAGNEPAAAHVVCVNVTSALKALSSSTQVVIQEPQNQTLSLDPDFQFHGLHDISLWGNDITVTCESGVGLTFIQSRRISIEGVEFRHCSAAHNSTSRNYSVTGTGQKLEFLQFKAGLYFESCEDISFTSVTITQSDGIGLAMYGTVGENSFEHCAFSDNEASGTEWGGGGAYIEFPYCSPGNPHSCNLSAYSGSLYEFSHCNFTDNVAHAYHPVEFPFLYPQDENHLSMGRGGGLCAFFMNAFNMSLTLNNCTFAHNNAAWGGGLFVEFQGGSAGNVLQVNNTVFINNSANTSHNNDSDTSQLPYRTGGGGARVGIVFPHDKLSVNNRVLFYNVCFHDNSAYWGGGVSFGAVREPNTTAPSNELRFDMCYWRGNHGRVGAAVELSLLYQATSGNAAEGYFNDCTFECNHNLAYSNDARDRYIGRGTVMADGITISLEGSNNFFHNNRTAIVVEDAYLNFLGNSIINFTGNVGRTGGAISLWGHAFMVLHEYTDLTFVRNHAYHRGGAIAAVSYSRHILYTFLNCFIQYADTSREPWHWNTHFYFRDNTQGAGVPNAIHATSLKSCLWNKWGPSNWNTTVMKELLFCWSPTQWNYSDVDCTNTCRSMSHLITSSAATFHNPNPSHIIQVVPGEPTFMNLSLHDDHFNDVTNQTVLSVFSHEPKDAVVFTEEPSEGHFEFTTNRKVTLYGKENTFALLWVETNDPRSLLARVNITVQKCPPGFTKKNDHAECMCQNNVSFGGIVVCSGDNAFQSKIRHAWWIGEHKNVTVVAQSPFMVNNTLTPYVPIPRNLSEVCTSNRTGILCSKCVGKHGFAVYSRNKPCIPCSGDVTEYSWVLFILVEFVPIGILFVVLWFIGFKATNGPANAFICYAQLITTAFMITVDGFLPISNTVHDHPAVEILQQSYMVIYDIWNLNFFRDVRPLDRFCLSPSLNVLDLLMLEYLAAFFPLLLILILLIINRIKPLSFSPLSAVATFLVLTFSKITIITSRIIHPSSVINATGTTLHTVPYFYGEWDYGHGWHKVYVTVAVVIGLVFLVLPTLILILYPIAGHIGCQRFVDWIGRATKQRVPLFLNEFYGFYKDGVYERNVPDLQIMEDSSSQSSKLRKVASQDYRFTAGLYFILRIVILVTHVSTNTWMEALVTQQIIITIAVLYFSIFRPYKHDLYNILDALTFTVLGTVNIITIYNTMKAARGETLTPDVFAIQYFFVYLPLIWMSVGILIFNRKWILDKAESLRGRFATIRLCCRKGEYNVLPQSSPVPSCSVSLSSAERVQDNNLSQSVRFSQEASPSNSQRHRSSHENYGGKLLKRQRSRFSTGRPTGYQLEESMRLGDH